MEIPFPLHTHTLYLRLYSLLNHMANNNVATWFTLQSPNFLLAAWASSMFAKRIIQLPWTVLQSKINSKSCLNNKHNLIILTSPHTETNLRSLVCIFILFYMPSQLCSWHFKVALVYPETWSKGDYNAEHYSIFF